ncbi:MAG: hypothetical protein ACXWCG_07740, partial [Flavitalea sp.]
QNYQAIHGSIYSGSLGIYNNPATGIHTPYNWDLTLFSAQSKSSTNGFTSDKPLLQLANSQVYLSNGDKKRFIHMSEDAHLLNARFKWDQHRAFAFGFNSRNYVHVKSQPFKFLDTISTFTSFLKFNNPTPLIGGNVVNNSWAEIYVSYSQILRKTNLDQLSAGITLKALRGVSGLYVQLDKMQFTETILAGSTASFVLTDAIGKYGYSSNYDKLKEDKTFSKNLNDFLTYTQGSMGIDLGVEYLIKTDYVPQYDQEEKLEYEWKIGISLLDLGRNIFKYGQYSREFSGVQPNITEVDLENKFSSLDNLDDFYDSLETVVQQLNSLGTKFYVWQPTRLVINVDRPITDNFYINGELSLNFFSTQNKNTHHTREMNLITVTPRWETSFFGAYLPVQLNTQGQLWIGSALKAGPLLIGIHDWRWVFSKDHVFNGGAYLAVVVRNFFSSSSKSKRIRYMECVSQTKW